MDVDKIIERLCKLQEEVWRRALNSEGSADCFCRKSGFWTCEGYSGNFDGGYRNDAASLEFIEKSVRDALDRLTPNVELRGDALLRRPS